MVTLGETTELSEMHDAVGKWTQLCPRLIHCRKNVSQSRKTSHKETQSSLKATQPHVSVMQTTTRLLLQTSKKIFARNIFEKLSVESEWMWFDYLKKKKYI